jgi:hypothetical protein
MDNRTGFTTTHEKLAFPGDVTLTVCRPGRCFDLRLQEGKQAVQIRKTSPLARPSTLERRSPGHPWRLLPNAQQEGSIPGVDGYFRLVAAVNR